MNEPIVFSLEKTIPIVDFDYKSIAMARMKNSASFSRSGGRSVRKSLDKHTVKELKELANRRGIKVSGLKKSEIIAKLHK